VEEAHYEFCPSVSMVLLAYLPCNFRHAKTSTDLPFSHLRISGLLGRVIVKSPRLLRYESIGIDVLLPLDDNRRVRLLLDPGPRSVGRHDCVNRRDVFIDIKGVRLSVGTSQVRDTL
jgi:hypothetical protein